jgi:DNA-binding LacI/PurR family transcriptional regulator
MSRRPTIKDIATLAGVTPTTVSLALNGNPRISIETRDRISKIAKQLRYVPNYMARGLVGSQSKTLGLVITSMLNPFYPELSKGIEDKALELGYTVILCSTTHDHGLQGRYIDLLRSRGVDGVVFASVEVNDPDIKPLLDDGFPFVLVNRKLGNRRLDRKTDWVVLDNFAGGYMAMQHLLRLGHRRIAVITGPMTVSTALERTKGARQAMVDAGLPLDPALVVQCDFSTERAYEETRKLLARPSRPTAMFSQTDHMALGVREAVYEAGLRIPEDVALVGFDNIAAGALHGVELTTISQKIYEMGTMAIDLLCKRIGKPSAPTSQVVLEPEIVIRRSCGYRQEGKAESSPEA